MTERNTYTPTLRHQGLYPCEAEIARRLSQSEKHWRRIAPQLERQGLPKIDPIMKGRYWPAVEAFFRNRHFPPTGRTIGCRGRGRSRGRRCPMMWRRGRQRRGRASGGVASGAAKCRPGLLPIGRLAMSEQSCPERMGQRTLQRSAVTASGSSQVSGCCTSLRGRRG